MRLATPASVDANCVSACVGPVFMVTLMLFDFLSGRDWGESPPSSAPCMQIVNSKIVGRAEFNSQPDQWTLLCLSWDKTLPLAVN